MIWAQIAYAISNTSHNHSLLNLSATKVTIQRLKQPILFCSVRVAWMGLKAEARDVHCIEELHSAVRNGDSYKTENADNEKASACVVKTQMFAVTIP